MIKFVRIRIKAKRGPSVIDGRLVEFDSERELLAQEDAVNKWVLQGFDVIHSLTIEEITGVYVVFVLYKKLSFPPGD
jgi:hypothetical protein